MLLWIARCCFIILLCAATPVWALNVQEVTSPRGIKAWLVEDHTTPLFTLHFAFRGGVEQDAPDQQGLSTLFADMLTEGAGKRDAQAFQHALAANSISFGLEAGRDAINGQLSGLTESLPIAAALAREALTAPRFDDEALKRLKQRQASAITARLADPEWQARRLLFATIYPDHPYAMRSLGTAQSLAALQVKHLRQAQNERLARNNLVVAAVGDITPAQLQTLLDNIFGDLPAQPVLRVIEDVAAPATGQVIALKHVGGQSQLLFVAPGIKRDDPDWHAASLLNYILGGGGFESRLMAEVRDQRGLTYGIDTALSAAAHSGIIVGDAKTANNKAGEAWDATRAVWETLWEEGVTAAELKAAQDYAVGALPTSFTSSGAIAGMLLSLQKDQLPKDYLEQRAALLRAVTRADVKRVAQRLLDPARLTLIVVGQPKGIAAHREEEFVRD